MADKNVYSEVEVFSAFAAPQCCWDGLDLNNSKFHIVYRLSELSRPGLEY